MLQSIRNYAGSFVVKILFVVLILSFFVWGIADVFRPTQGDTWAAKVADQTISREAFDQEYQATARRLQSQVGGNLDPEQMRQLGLGRNVIDQMVNRALMTEAAAGLAIATPEAVAKQLIARDQRFRNAQGQFDPQVLRAFLRRLGSNEKAFLAEVRNEVDVTTLLDGLTGGAAVPAVLAEAIRGYVTEKRTVDYLRIGFDQQKVGEPDPAALEAYFASHGDAYRTPELRAVEVLVVDPASVAGQVQIGDADLKTAYEERLGDFVTPERRSFRQLLFNDEAKARAAAERVATGASLEAAAAAVGDGTPPPASIGPVAAAQLPTGLREPLFAAAKGVLSAPVRSSLGWHVVEITAIEPEVVAPLAEVSTRLRQALTQEKATELTIDIGNRIEDGLGRGLPLDEIARSVGLAPRTLAALTADGRDAAGKPIPDLPPKLAGTAFATAKGKTSDLVEAAADQYFLVRVIEVTESTPRPFADVKAEVRTAWLAERRRQQATEIADKVAQRAGGGTALADAGRDFGLPVAKAGPFDRQTTPDDGPLPAAVVRRALEGPAATVLTVPTEEAIFILKASTLPTPPPGPSAAIDGEIRQVQAAMRDDLLAQYLAALRSRYPVSINERVVAGTPAGG